MNFKVGDRVRLIGPTYSKRLNTTARVISISVNDMMAITVKFDSDNYVDNFFSYRFELIRPNDPEKVCKSK